MGTGFGLARKLRAGGSARTTRATFMESTMADNLFARIIRVVQNMSRIHREREVSSRIQAVEAFVREASRECQEVEERLRKLKPPSQ